MAVDYGIYAQRYNAMRAWRRGWSSASTPSPRTSQRFPVRGARRRWRLRGGVGERLVRMAVAYGIYARSYSAAGVAQDATEFRVNSCHHRTNSAFPSVAMDADGDFVVAWHERGVRMASGVRHLRAALHRHWRGALDALEFRVNICHHEPTALSLRGDRRRWRLRRGVGMSDGQDGDGVYGVYAQRYNASAGVAQDVAEFRKLTPVTTDSQGASLPWRWTPTATSSSRGRSNLGQDGSAATASTRSATTLRVWLRMPWSSASTPVTTLSVKAIALRGDGHRRRLRRRVGEQ